MIVSYHNNTTSVDAVKRGKTLKLLLRVDPFLMLFDRMVFFPQVHVRNMKNHEKGHMIKRKCQKFPLCYDCYGNIHFLKICLPTQKLDDSFVDGP